MTHALVTGATGFIGRYLVRHLVESGNRVTCLVRKTSDRAPIEELDVTFAVGNINDPASLKRAVVAVDVVYHLAAMLKTPWRKDFISTNVEGTGNVAEACALVDRPPILVVVSSIAAAGPTPADESLTESVDAAPISKYGRSKLNGELAARQHAEVVPITIVRPAAVYGEGDRATLPFFKAASLGIGLVPTLADNRLSLVYAGDLVWLLREAALRGERLPPPTTADCDPGRGVYYAAHDEQPTLKELGQLLGDVFGHDKIGTVRVPSWLTRSVGAIGEVVGRLRDNPSTVNWDKTREATAGSWICSPNKAREQLGFTPSNLSHQLDTTAGWYKEVDWI